MTPEERERLKEAEKAHLRQLKALKSQYRDAKRKRGLLDALQGMIRPDIDEVHDEMVDKLTRKNIESEARFEIAMENAGIDGEDPLDKAVRQEAEREALRKAEADELVRQFKQEMGGGSPAVPSGDETERTPSRTAPSAPSGTKTIGRTPPPVEEPEADDASSQDGTDDDVPLGPKSIGRPRRSR